MLDHITCSDGQTFVPETPVELRLTDGIAVFNSTLSSAIDIRDTRIEFITEWASNALNGPPIPQDVLRSIVGSLSGQASCEMEGENLRLSCSGNSFIFAPPASSVT